MPKQPTYQAGKLEEGVGNQAFLPTLPLAVAGENAKLYRVTEEGAQTMCVRVELEGRTVTALVDTAASHNFVREGLLRHVTTRFPPCRLQFATVRQGGHATSTACVNIGVRDLVTKAEVLSVPDLCEELILGIPWLTANHAVIEPHLGRLHIGTRGRWTLYTVGAAPPSAAACVPLEQFDHQVPPQHQAAVQQLLQQYAPVFNHKGPLHRTTAAEHAILTTHDQPVYDKPRDPGIFFHNVINKQVCGMLNEHVIEPTNSLYNSCITLAPKKTGEWRFCVDFRPLNSVTIDLPPPLLNLKDTLSTLGPATVFSALDMKSGYWQIPIRAQDREKTAFTTPDGRRFQFVAMPFGLKCAPATFQKLMVKVLDGYINNFTVAYLDDVLIWSRNWEEHLHHLSLVFERLEQHGLTCGVDKCKLGLSKLAFLGHYVTPYGHEPDPEQLSKIQEAKNPRTRKQVRKYFGLINWLREFIPNFAQITAPLTALLAGNKKIEWTNEAEAAFHASKQAFQNCKQLARFDPALPVVVQTDASQEGVGCVIYQTDQSESRYIIGYHSAKFGAVERKYHVNEQECLAIIHALKKYRPYLLGRHFTLRTDNRCLLWLKNMHNGKSKLARWALMLQEYDFTVEHVAGEANEFADALSRNPNLNETVRDEIEWEGVLPPVSEVVGRGMIPPTLQRITVANHDTLSPITAGDVMRVVLQSQITSPEAEKYRTKCSQQAVEGWRVVDGEVQVRLPGMRERWRTFVPTPRRQNVLQFAHDSQAAGHPGAEQTRRNIMKHFHWPGLGRDARNYVRECVICNTRKARRSDGDAPQQPRQPDTAFKTVALDIMGPYPRTSTGKRFLLVVTDLFTRWVEAFPVNNTKTKTIASILEREFFPRWGYPAQLLTDNGTQFVGKVWRNFCTHWHVEHLTTPSYHPRANPTERRNQEIKVQLRVRLGDDHTAWADLIPAIMFCIRNRTNAATGKTPAEMVQGRELRTAGALGEKPGTPPDQIITKQQDIHSQARQHQQAYLSTWVPASKHPPKTLEEGMYVYVRENHLSAAKNNFNAGLAPKWRGPVRVTRKLSENTFLVNIGGRRVQKKHRDDLRIARGPGERGENPPEPTITPTATPSSSQSYVSPGVNNATSEARIIESPFRGFNPSSNSTPHSVEPRSNESQIQSVSASPFLGFSAVNNASVEVQSDFRGFDSPSRSSNAGRECANDGSLTGDPMTTPRRTRQAVRRAAHASRAALRRGTKRCREPPLVAVIEDPVNSPPPARRRRVGLPHGNVLSVRQ